jgi:hypothetical protein
MGVIGLRTQYELKNISALRLEEVMEPKKKLCSTSVNMLHVCDLKKL